MFSTLELGINVELEKEVRGVNTGITSLKKQVIPLRLLDNFKQEKRPAYGKCFSYLSMVERTIKQEC